MKEREPTKNKRREATFFLPTTEPPQPLPQLADGDSLKGLVDLEAAACLCTALKANVLGIKLNVPVSLSLLLNARPINASWGEYISSLFNIHLSLYQSLKLSIFNF
ncbi:BnaCnng34320D [Brassica napus]|uniref:(rape) hypothetical protein n=1 Tax=Brassica napus TaxID=3708 RepID=A0A078J133_BRANA|nr:unnamed protein product [Brassica napus]CDY59112.1 BnaCnng34320D [Brassica napus]